MRARRTWLVTGARAPAALEIIRRLGRAGQDVLAADCTRAPVGRFSRYARGYFRLPGPRADPGGFLEALCRVVMEEKVSVLLPTCEEIYHLGRHRARLAEVCEVFCPEFDVLSALHHKGRFARLTHELGGPVVAPESVLVEDAGQLRRLAAESRAWVFKPVYSRSAARTLICPEEGQAARLELDPINPWLAQRFISGHEVSSYGIAVDGRLTAHTSYRSHHHAGQAAGICFTARENAALLRFVERLAGHLKFTGQIGFDFIVCAETGRAFVLECNPRATSGVHLLGEEFDFVGALQGETVAAGRPRAKMLGAAMLSTGFGQALRTARVGSWWRDFVEAEDVVFARDDRLPAWGQVASVAELGVLGLRRRMGLLAASTADIEWNG